MATIRIMLVEDQEIVRKGLRRLLELEPDMEVVAEASSGEEALSLVSALSPEVVLTDIKMSGMGGIEFIRQLRKVNPGCHILVLSLYDEYLPQAIEAGAGGYLLKDLKQEELVRAIRAAKAGKAPLSLSLGRERWAELATKWSGPRYSEREIAVLRLVASGRSTQAIAQQLFLSERTVKRTLNRLFSKLGVHNRPEAVAEAIRRNLLQPDTP